MIKILKNNTQEDIRAVGKFIPINSQIILQPSLWLEAQEEDQLKDDIFSRRIIVNNGTSDLSPEDGWKWITILAEKDFSYGWKNIPLENIVEIPDNQQMIVKGRMKINGRLKVRGNLWVI